MAAVLPVFSALSGVAGAVVGGISQANAANYQAEVARQNQLIAQQQASRAAAATSAATEAAGLRARQQSAQVGAALAANNLDVTSGSPSDVEAAQRELGRFDVGNTATRGAQQVYGYEAQGVGYQNQAALDQSQAGYDILGGVLKGGSLLESASPNLNLSNAFKWLGGNPPSNGIDSGYGDDLGNLTVAG